MRVVQAPATPAGPTSTQEIKLDFSSAGLVQIHRRTPTLLQYRGVAPLRPRCSFDVLQHVLWRSLVAFKRSVHHIAVNTVMSHIPAFSPVSRAPLQFFNVSASPAPFLVHPLRQFRKCGGVRRKWFVLLYIFICTGLTNCNCWQ